MYTLPRSKYLRQSLIINGSRAPLPVIVNPISHRDRVMQDLRNLGVTKLGLARMESRYLPHIIHPDEIIGGVVYGHSQDGFVMLIATETRVIFLDKKPLYVNQDEITYYVISGISISHAGVGSTVTLHTRIKDYKIRTYNYKCANNFVEYIETRCLEHNDGNKDRYDQLT